MPDQNDLLQTCLEELEQGAPLEKVLKALPADAQDIAPLIRLAAAARVIQHPVMRPEIARAQQNAVARAANSIRPTRPIRTEPTRPGWLNWLLTPRNSFALGGAFALFLVLIAAAIGINMLFNSGNVAKLANVTGLVEVASAADGSDWHFVSTGEPLQAGQHIRTYADSTVTLAYYEGSQTLIGPGSELLVTDLGRNGEALQVKLSQTAGTTSNTVVPLRGSDSYFNIDTPSGLVVVHGTSFDVDVIPGGEVLFAVNHGKVQVKNEVSDVFLLSGQATRAFAGADIEQPGYQFTLVGEVQSIQDDEWIVNGAQFSVTPDTEILGTYGPGDMVSVKGRILEGGEWVADRIEPAQANKKPKSSFTGVIDSMPSVPGVWTISGIEVAVDRDTELASGLDNGVAVKVTYEIQEDGSKLAKEIELLEEENPSATETPEPSETPSETSTMTSTATSTGTETATDTPSPTVTGTPATETPTPTLTMTPSVMPKNENSRCDNRDNPQPEGLRLAQKYGVTYDEIIAWFCKGFGFGEIDLAYGLSVDSGIPVSEIFRMRSDGKGWGEIKKTVGAQITVTATPRPANTRQPTQKPSHTPKPKK